MSYAGVKAEKKLSLFSVPKDESRRKTWERNLHRSDKALEENCAVCELHFEDRYILREYVHIIDGKEVRIAHGVPALTPDAVPTVLPNAPKYLSTKLPPKRAPRKREAPTVPGPQNSKKACTSTPVDEDFESQGDVHDVPTAAAGARRHARSRPIQFARSAPYSVNECRLSKSAPSSVVETDQLTHFRKTLISASAGATLPPSSREEKPERRQSSHTGYRFFLLRLRAAGVPPRAERMCG
ncbi:hypothetical protein HPB52_008797 [Rhipicephalus sanguineus]|uniref:THAP-type domain-containing protein n=1 Tax=Rhipicephalus sanguineus TaxID=34632 RepID=A0A9D4SZT5_RHISA|nr:hypothetical protein HPB52_008797 [Rhipicephalus sanguineus]